MRADLLGGGTATLDFKAETIRIGQLQIVSGMCRFNDGVTRDGYKVLLEWDNFNFVGVQLGKLFDNLDYSLTATPITDGNVQSQPIAPMVETDFRTAAWAELGCADDPSVGNIGFSFTAIGRWKD